MVFATSDGRLHCLARYPLESSRRPTRPAAYPVQRKSHAAGWAAAEAIWLSKSCANANSAAYPVRRSGQVQRGAPQGGQLLRLYASRCSVAVSGSGSDDGGFCGLSLSGFLWVAARAPLKGCSVSDREAPNQHAVRHNYIPLPTRRNLTPPAPSKWLVSRGNARGIIVAVWAEVIATSLFVLPRVRLDLVRGVGYVRRAQVPAYHRRGLVEVVAGGGIGLATQHAAEPHRDQGKEHTGAEPRPLPPRAQQQVLAGRGVRCAQGALPVCRRSTIGGMHARR